MNKEESKKLVRDLGQELMEIDRELSSIATENPLIKGDFEVRVEDIGSSPDDTAQEAGELDRLQAMVNSLVVKRKAIVGMLDKLK